MQQLTRTEAIEAFTQIHAELLTIKDSDNFRAHQFIASRDRITALADRGALLIPAIPLALDLPRLWGYADQGILAEDGGAPIHAFHRRLFHYLNAAKRILDILRDDLLWKLHGTALMQATQQGSRSEQDTAEARSVTLVSPRPTMFIGSTVEALDVARAAHSELDYDIEIRRAAKRLGRRR